MERRAKWGFGFVGISCWLGARQARSTGFVQFAVLATKQLEQNPSNTRIRSARGQGTSEA